ncbi:MAG: MFS transporter [Burkholderiaceae bacterium]
MNTTDSGIRPVLPILIGASVLLTLAMGLRQSLGLFMTPMTQDIGITVSQFTLAVAVQNLAWGLFQAPAGAWAVRVGFRPLMVGGALLYVLGLGLLATANGMLNVVLGAGVAIGASMALAGNAITMAVSARAVSPALRSTVLGIVSAAGSLGALVSAPIGQGLAQEYGWRIGVYGFVVLALMMIPAALFAGRVDRIPLPPSESRNDVKASVVAKAAMRHAPFVVMSLAYFVCGMQLVFLTTHLPAYLSICGMDPMLSAQALGVIGGFNILGSLFFGWAGGRWNKLALLGLIYTLRSCVLAWYFMSPPSPTSTLVFAALMGFLWLGVGPLVAGWIGDTFGLRWQAMVGGLAFVVHQIGSTLGAFGGGIVYDLLGSYDMAWKFGVSLGLVAGLTQILFSMRDSPPPRLAPAGA